MTELSWDQLISGDVPGADPPETEAAAGTPPAVADLEVKHHAEPELVPLRDLVPELVVGPTSHARAGEQPRAVEQEPAAGDDGLAGELDGGGEPVPCPGGSGAHPLTAQDGGSGGHPSGHGAEAEVDAERQARADGHADAVVAPVAESEADDLRELEERVAVVLRSPETLRSVHQPIVDLRTGECVGYEALVRVAEWPARAPGPWLDAAARAGLAAQLEAAALAASLRARLTMPGDRFLTVNLSAASLAEPAVLRVLADEDDLARVVIAPAPAHGLLPPAPAASALADLRGRHLGLAVRIDQGGRSDLASVHALRPDVITLHRAFSLDLHTDALRRRLVRTVVSMAVDMDATVLAEGVEAVADARALQECGVQLGQGWLFGRARPGFLPPAGGTQSWLGATWTGEAPTADAAPAPAAAMLPRPRSAPAGGSGRHTAEQPHIAP